MKNFKAFIFIGLSWLTVACNVATDEAVENNAAIEAQSSDASTETFEYSSSSVELIENTSYLNINPLTNFSGVIFSITPFLPDGLRFDAGNGVIYGTPEETFAVTDYIITATHSTGTDFAHITLSVIEEPPKTVSYDSAILNFTRDVADNYTIDDLTGGTPDTYTLDDELNLPAGLVFNDTTGEISGTPTAAGSASFVLTIANDSGSASTNITIIVADVAPQTLTYTDDGQIIDVAEPLTLMQAGLVVEPDNVSYKISPNLPDGLTLNTATGDISGTPTTTFYNSTHTITAYNDEGSATVDITLEVEHPAEDLEYPIDEIEFEQNITMTSVPKSSYTGGTPVTYSCTACPTGISVNSTTGRISGSTADALGTGTFTLVATHTTPYTATVTTASWPINYAIVEDKPDDEDYLGYSTTYTLYTGSTVSLTPAALAGGNASSYELADESFGIVSASPDIYNLPITGLTFNYDTGEISGTPSAAAEATFTVLGFNLDETSTAVQTATQTITIKVEVLAPQELGYLNTPPAEYNAVTEIIELTQNVALAANIEPDISGGDPDNYSISPALPDGLSFNTTTGVISGTPTETATVTYHSITGENSAGSYTETIAIQVD